MQLDAFFAQSGRCWPCRHLADLDTASLGVVGLPATRPVLPATEAQPIGHHVAMKSSATYAATTWCCLR